MTQCSDVMILQPLKIPRASWSCGMKCLWLLYIYVVSWSTNWFIGIQVLRFSVFGPWSSVHLPCLGQPCLATACCSSSSSRGACPGSGCVRKIETNVGRSLIRYLLIKTVLGWVSWVLSLMICLITFSFHVDTQEPQKWHPITALGSVFLIALACTVLADSCRGPRTKVWVKSVSAPTPALCAWLYPGPILVSGELPWILSVSPSMKFWRFCFLTTARIFSFASSMVPSFPSAILCHWLGFFASLRVRRE